MSKLVQQATTELRNTIRSAMEKACANGELPQADIPEFSIEVPADRAHGDCATNAAMASARAFHAAPAQNRGGNHRTTCPLDGTYFDRCEIAGPGFINFFLSTPVLCRRAKGYSKRSGTEYGRSDYGQGKKIMVEFVSANPTGPMHMGNARGGALGDCLAAVLDAAGYNVWREFYVNDAGNQIEKFGHVPRSALPADFYRRGRRGIPGGRLPRRRHQGARRGVCRGNTATAMWMQPEQERRKALVDYRAAAEHREDEERPGQIPHRIRRVVLGKRRCTTTAQSTRPSQMLKEKGMTYEKDGALWYQATTELRRAKRTRCWCAQNGNPTYFAADIAYHHNKFADARL